MTGRHWASRVAVVLFTGLWWVAPLLAQQPPAQQQPPPLERARALYDAGQLTGARDVLRALVRTQPNDAGAYLLLGVVERTLGELPAAIVSLERAHALNPASNQATIELATTLAWHRDLDRAIQLYRQVLEHDPSYPGARTGLGFGLAWQGHLDDAAAVFRDVVGAEPNSTDAWNGLGFVERARLQRTDAEAAYRRTLELDPKNKDATDGLKALYWDRRMDIRALGGGSTLPDATWEPEARVDVSYAAGPRVTVGGGYQHYAYGVALPIGGAPPPAARRQEDSVEASVVLRPSERFTLGTSLYTFLSDGANRGVVVAEGVFALTEHVALTGSIRPAFSSITPTSLVAGGGGAVISLPRGNSFALRALVAADTTYEPRLTLFADYGVETRRLRMRVSVANSATDEQFAFTSVAVTSSWLFTPSFGLSVMANTRTQTYQRSEVLVGLRLRR